MMSERERENLMERAREIAVDDLSAMTASWLDTQAFARALLFTSAALALVDKGFRTRKLKDASIIAGNDVKALSEIVSAALSGIEPGEDEQARGQGRSASISTDTKGTTK